MSKARRLIEQIQSTNLGIGNKSILVLDGGSYVAIAERLGRDVSEVNYFLPFFCSDLKVARSHIGEGIDGVNTIYDFWNHLDADLIFCPDAYNEDLFIYLDKDHNVVHARESSILELDKEKANKELENAGIRVPKYEKIKGLSNLINRLKNQKKKMYVKPKSFRGESETFQYENIESAQAKFDKISLTLGPFSESYEFLITDPIEGLEGGVDGIVFDGEYLNPLLFGFTTGYLYTGKILNFDEIPDPYKTTMSKLLTLFSKYKARTFFGTEEILSKDKKTSYLLDGTLRMSNIHVSGLWSLAENFSEVLFGLGSKYDGEKVEPIINGKYFASAVLVTSTEIKDEWAVIKAPEGSESWLKLEYYSKANGDFHVAPKGQNTVGCILSLGNSWDEVIDSLQEKFEQISCSIAFDPIPAKSEYEDLISKIKSYGIEF